MRKIHKWLFVLSFILIAIAIYPIPNGKLQVNAQTGVRVGFVKDNNGNIIEFSEPLASSNQVFIQK